MIWKEMSILLLTLVQILIASTFNDIPPNKEKTDYGCLTPNLKPAICISLYACPTILKLFLNPPGSAEDKRFLQNSFCPNGFGVPPFVCCSYEDRFTDTESWSNGNKDVFIDTESRPKEIKPRFKERNLVAGPEECSDRSSYTFKRDALLNSTEYGWLAILERDSKSGYNEGYVDSLCIGSLISHRHILSSAQCIQGRSFVGAGKLTKARLGAYDVHGAFVCMHPHCLEPPIVIDIEKIIVHENYNSGQKLNDISLIRLTKDVRYNDMVSPICLPNTIGSSQIMDDVYVAGWSESKPGEIEYYKSAQNLYILEQNDCIAKYKGRTNISRTHICANFHNSTKDKCRLAFGTPLMRLYNRKWIIEGIISFDATHCGAGESLPGVYTRVADYEDWIRSNLEE